MPYTCEWLLNKENIMFLEYDGVWTIRDFFESISQSLSMGLECESIYDIIIHVKTSPNLRINPMYATRVALQPAPKLGHLYLIADHSFDKVMTHIIARMSSRYLAMDTVDNALAQIENHRASQNPS
jgi:hypothetical protein